VFACVCVHRCSRMPFGHSDRWIALTLSLCLSWQEVGLETAQLVAEGGAGRKAKEGGDGEVRGEIHAAQCPPQCDNNNHTPNASLISCHNMPITTTNHRHYYIKKPQLSPSYCSRNVQPTTIATITRLSSCASLINYYANKTDKTSQTLTD